jgi:phosphonate transport system substrate-binding protein
MTESSPADESAEKSRYNPWPLICTIVLVAIVFGVVGYAIDEYRIQRPLEADINKINTLYVSMTGLSRPIVNHLDPRFGTANADLVANPPADAAKQIDPTPLLFSYVATEQPEKYRDAFKECCDALSKQIGRPVEYVIFSSTDDELNAMRDGKVQVAAFSTGTVPIAVDAAGFVPFCCLGSEVGAFGERGGDYKVMILVRPDSPIHTLDDLKGHELGLTEPNSNSGYKAPLVLLSRDHGLLPGRDFSIRYSGGQETSIAWLAKGTFEVAAVASDVLARAIAEKQISASQFRVIYTSEPFPPACFGYAYNLDPKLASRIKTAMLAFPWQNTGLAKLFGPTGQDQFIPVSYKDDWALVRQIDDAIGNAHVLK